MPDETDVRVDAEKLYLLGVRALLKVGVPDEHARMAADVLIASDLRGIESHGFARFADFYVYRARDGHLNLSPQRPRRRGTPSHRRPSMATAASASSRARLAMRLAIQKARRPAWAWSRCATARTTARPRPTR